MLRTHFLLTGLSFCILLLSLNRLSILTQVHLQPDEFLRLMDFNAMLPIPLISILLYFLLQQTVLRDSARKTKHYQLLMIIFVSGVYLFGAGSGVHEVTNYLNIRFCDAGGVTTSLCHIIEFNDDKFSHLVYYLGFLLINLSLITLAYSSPRQKSVTKRDIMFLSINSLFIAIGIFANLAFEETGFDLFFFGAVMLYSLYLLIIRSKNYRVMPVLFYFTLSYSTGILCTILYKMFIR